MSLWMRCCSHHRKTKATKSVGRHRRVLKWMLFMLSVFLGFAVASYVQLHFLLFTNKETVTLFRKTTIFRPALIEPLLPPGEPSSALDEKENLLNLLFIGVITSEKHIHTRAVALFDTWGRQMNGHIRFFMAGSTTSAIKADFPVENLVGVDDNRYPPQRKSFLMLKYMYDNLINSYEWFMRVDDDVYVKIGKLKRLLFFLNSTKPLYIGQGGSGTEKEIGKLGLAKEGNFCMGGPGVVFSRKMLRLLGPHLLACLRATETAHEDVEIGKCVQSVAGISCTRNTEMASMFLHFDQPSELLLAPVNWPLLQRAVTVHPLKEATAMRRMHMLALEAELHDLRYESRLLNDQVSTSLEYLKSQQLSTGKRFLESSSLESFAPRIAEEIIPWEFFTSNVYYTSTEPFRPGYRIPGSFEQSINELVGQTMELINTDSFHNGECFEFERFKYAQMRVDPVDGVFYVLNFVALLERFQKQPRLTEVKKHLVVRRRFLPPEIVEIERPRSRSPLHPDRLKRDEETINFIVPVRGRFRQLTRFLSNFEQTCLKNNETVRLIISYFPSYTMNDSRVEYLVNFLNKKYAHPKQPKRLHLLNVKERIFSRAVLRHEGTKLCSPDSLMFFTDVDMVLTRELLAKIRKNTLKGRQVFFPVVFSKYHPDALAAALSSTQGRFNCSPLQGYFRYYGAGMVGVYKRDYDAVGGFNLHIKGYGREDVELLLQFMKNDKYIVFRSPEPHLMHIYHPASCAEEKLTKEKRLLCSIARARSRFSVYHLADLLMRSNLLSSFEEKTKNKLHVRPQVNTHITSEN